MIESYNAKLDNRYDDIRNKMSDFKEYLESKGLELIVDYDKMICIEDIETGDTIWSELWEIKP